MKKLLFLFVSAIILSSCGSSTQNGNVYVTAETQNLGDGLDLQALGEIVKSSSNAQEIESKLNQPNSINNLDLDGDGQVDYIKVTEYGSGANRGFSFTVDTKDGQTQELASVEVSKINDQQANMSINGNQTIYGGNAHYASNFTMTDLLIMSYLFHPHPVYVSPWRYGYYPSYYHSYVPVARTSYSSRVSSTTKTSRITRTTTTRQSTSPNRNLTSSSVSTRAKALSAPTTSQRSFTRTSSSNSRPSTSGFKSSSPSRSSSSWSSSSRSSSPSRSSSSWGSSSRSSSRSSFGSSSRSSSRSFGSSSRRR